MASLETWGRAERRTVLAAPKEPVRAPAGLLFREALRFSVTLWMSRVGPRTSRKLYIAGVEHLRVGAVLMWLMSDQWKTPSRATRGPPPSPAVLSISSSSSVDSPPPPPPPRCAWSSSFA